MLRPQIDINICSIHLYIQSIQKDLLYLPKVYVSVEFALVKTTFEIIASEWDDDNELMNCFCGMVDRRKTFSLISSRDHCQRSSPSWISDTSRAGFEPAQSLSSGLVEWSCTVVITTTQRRQIWRESTLKTSLIIEIKKAKFFPANLQNKKREKGVPFVITYHPILNSLNKIIRDNMYLLNMNEEVRKTFSPRPIVSFQSARKLSSYLVRAKLDPLQRKTDSWKCGKRRCEVWNNVTGTTILSSTVTGDTFKINHSLNRSLS